MEQEYLDPLLVICMRAAKEGILSDRNAYLEAYTISTIFSQCANTEIEKLINEKEGVTPEEKEETKAWHQRVSRQMEEERKLDKKRFNLQK